MSKVTKTVSAHSLEYIQAEESTKVACASSITYDQISRLRDIHCRQDIYSPQECARTEHDHETLQGYQGSHNTNKSMITRDEPPFFGDIPKLHTNCV